MFWEVVNPARGEGNAGDGGMLEEGGICGPGVRWGHSCNAVMGGRYLYIFGGYGGDNCQTNDVHVFDAVNQSWTKPTLNGSPPSPRDSHSCTTVGDKLFIFGGTDGKNPLKDMHILDTTSNTWFVPNLYGEGPNAREGHGAVLVDKRLFIFGGCGKSETHEEKYYNDLYILDTEKFTWERAVTSGSAPTARDCHSCSSWKNKIIVIGGEDSSDFYLADVHILNADTLVWEAVKTSGMMFPPRAGHTTVALGSNLFVFGGFTDAKNLYDDLYVLNVESRTWSKVIPANQGPSARFSVAGDCMDERKGILVFLGGCNKSLEALDDMYYLHTDMPVLNGLYERPKKLSVRRELRKRCWQEDPPGEITLKDNDLLKHQMTSHSLQIGDMRETDQAGNKVPDLKAAGKIAFVASVTNTNKYGYAIETIIDGKLLHGMLFSCTSNIRMTAGDVSDKGYMDQHICLTSIPVRTTEIIDQEHSDNPHAKKPKVSSPLLDPVGSNMTNLTPCAMAAWNLPQSAKAFGVVDDPKVPIVDQTLSGNLPALDAAQSSLFIQGITEQGSSSNRQAI